MTPPEQRRSSVVRAGILLASAALVALSFLPGWIAYERTIVGYGSARVVRALDAWSEFAAPPVPLAVILILAAGVLAIVPATTPRAAFLRAGGWVAAGGLALLFVLAAREVTLPAAITARRITVVAGPLFAVALGICLVVAVLGAVELFRSGRRSRQAAGTGAASRSETPREAEAAS